MRKLIVPLIACTILFLSASVCIAEETQKLGGQPNLPGEALFLLPAVSDGKELGLAYYYDRGICFAHGSGDKVNIKAVVILRPQNAGKSTSKIDISRDEVVPGVGAFGFRLGDSDSGYRGLVPDKYISTNKDGSRSYYTVHIIDEGKRVYVSTDKAGRCSGLVVAGRFRTPEGITEKNTIEEVIGVYGTPDVIWTLPAPLTEEAVLRSYSSVNKIKHGPITGFSVYIAPQLIVFLSLIGFSTVLLAVIIYRRHRRNI